MAINRCQVSLVDIATGNVYSCAQRLPAKFVIGTQPDCDIVLPYETYSRLGMKVAELRVSADGRATFTYFHRRCLLDGVQGGYAGRLEYDLSIGEHELEMEDAYRFKVMLSVAEPPTSGTTTTNEH